MSVSVPRCYDTTDPGLGADDRHGYRHPAHRRALRACCAACAAEGGGRGDYGMSTKITGIGLALAAALALGGLALHRHEPINALWIVTAAVCIYLLGYRFYAAWIAARVLSVDGSRATPAERLSNGRDFVPTHRWIAFGHHFAAIAGPGPLVGPTLAAQFGYLPGTLWLLVAAVLGGGWVDHREGIRDGFDYGALPLAGFVIVYGWTAAILPVWLLLAPRDYLSTFLKLGTVMLLAVAIVLTHPQTRMPAITQFIDGSGPLFGGKLFPFVFITIACGAISGFHSLVASGTTPKLISNEADVRLIGYGSMALESFVAVMAMIAATLLDPGVYFAINTAAGVVGATPEAAVQTISGWGFPVTADQMNRLAHAMGERRRPAGAGKQ